MTEVIEKTENKKGYKKTELGWIPEDWEIVKSGKLFHNYSKKNNKQEELLSVTQDKGVIPRSMVEARIAMPEGSTSSYKLVEKGDFVISLRSFQGGIEYSEYRGVVSPAYTILKRNLAISDGYYKQWFKSSEFIARLGVAIIGIRDGKQISYEDFSMLPICYPPLKEQEKIAEILSAWDEGIETLEKLIEQKEILKKATMQKLFFEKESWQMMRFDKIFKDFCKKNCPRERLLSATQENGVIPRDMLSGKVMSPEGSLNGYKLIEAGDFVISLRSFQGGLEYSKYRGILSPAYTVLKNIIDIDKNFYRHFFKSYKFIEKYLSISVIGIRDGKQISYSDLSSVKIPYPPLEEQEKIGKILNCYDEEFQLLNSKLEKLKEQKKSLMQKLLTGQIRVKI